MRSIFHTAILFFISLVPAGVCAQEVLLPLETNPLLDRATEGPKRHYKHGEPHVQKLPYFDDFSNYEGLYPNDTMWLDRFTYISKTMAVNPPSVGAVVFDGLNESGRPYRGVEDNSSYPSDTLTSTYIDLSPYDEGDSLYLSFFYQPQGLGDVPEPGDSLVLFFRPDSVSKWDSTAWFRVWSTPGAAVGNFRLAMIPIKEVTGSNYFNGKFQFRLVAYSSKSGNLDHWLVDYVYLNQGRQQDETTFEDVAGYKKSRSILNTYYSMPVRQAYAMSNPFAGDISVYGTNNSDIQKNVAFSYKVTNASAGTVLASRENTQGDNLDPQQHREFTLPNDLTKSHINGKRLTLKVSTSVKNIPDEFPVNDTAVHFQEFGDYLAYDDGTAERAYGLMNSPYGMVAVRFILPTPDTLYGFAIHFTFGTKDVSNKSFTLAVWDALSPQGQTQNDQPIRKINYTFPQYTDKINGFHYFKLEEPLAVKQQFYVGWIQSQDFMLNIGADLNYPDLSGGSNNPHLFVSTAAKWYNSSLNIAPMIRPYLGTDFVAGMPVLNKKPELKVRVFPNPTTGILHVETDPALNVQASLFGLDGRQISGVAQYRGSATLSYPNLKPGLYLLRLQADNGLVKHEKVMVR